MQRLASTDRVVFAGDSNTDGFTYPLIIQQALEEAERPVPLLIDGGVASDTAEKILRRLDSDVLFHRPTWVCVYAGGNDVSAKIPPQQFGSNIRAIGERLKREHVSILLMTTTMMGDSHADRNARLDEYNVWLQAYAAEARIPLADVNAAFKAAQANGVHNLHMPDDRHVTYRGYEIIARTLLDAFGCDDVPLPKVFKPRLMPGVISRWQIRAVADTNTRLDEASVAALRPDDSWKTYPLPETQPLDDWWFDQERQRGAALSLERELGKAPRYQCIAVIEERASRQVFLHIGASLETLWLNGRKLYQSSAWRGWHVDKERVSAELRAGKNTIVIETGAQFMLTMDETTTPDFRLR